jgi:hypothetical protein
MSLLPKRLLGELIRNIGKNGAAGAIDSTVEQPMFYSALREGIAGHPRSVGTGAEWLSSLIEPERIKTTHLRDENNKLLFDENKNPVMSKPQLIPERAVLPGVKLDEIESSQIRDYLSEMSDKPLRREDLLDFMAGGDGGGPNRGPRGTTLYAPKEWELGRKGPLLTEEEWSAKHGPEVETRRKRIADRQISDYDYWRPVVGTDEEIVGTLPDRAALIRELDDLNSSAESMLLTAQQMSDGRDMLGQQLYGNADPHTIAYYDRMARDYLLDAARPQAQLDYVDSLMARDPATPDLFTGELDSVVLGKELVPKRKEWTAKILKPDGTLLHQFDERFPSRYSAEDHAYSTPEWTNYHDTMRAAARQALDDSNFGYDSAFQDVRWSHPLQDPGVKAVYNTYTLRGGDDSIEKLWGVDPEYKTPMGRAFYNTHWNGGSRPDSSPGLGQPNPTRFAHSRSVDREWKMSQAELDGTMPPPPNADEIAIRQKYFDDALAAFNARVEVAKTLHPDVDKIPDLIAKDSPLQSLEYDVKGAQRALYKEIANGTTGLPPNPDQPMLTLKVKDMNEGQSDVHQIGQNNGYAREFTPEEQAQYEAIGSELIDMKNKQTAAYRIHRNARGAKEDHLYSDKYQNATQYNADPNSPEYMEQKRILRELDDAEKASHAEYLSYEKPIEDLEDAQSRLAGIRGEPMISRIDPQQKKRRPPKTPFKGDLWTNFIAKRSLREAVDEGKDIFAWPLNVSNGDAYWRSGNYYYEKMFLKAIEDITKKAGVKVQKRIVDGTNISQGGGPVHYAYVRLTPDLKKQLKEPMPLMMVPLLGGGGAATVAGATQGLLSRRRSDEKA